MATMMITCFPFFFAILLPAACSVSFRETCFYQNSNNILYRGDAVPRVGEIELIDRVNYVSQVGWAIYADSVPLWNVDTGEVTDFSTLFSLSIDTLGRGNYGHGLVLFLTPWGVDIPPNSIGGFLGLFNTTTSTASPNQIVAVESDSFYNSDWDPRDVDGHVGINNNSIASSVYTSWN